MTSDMNGSGVKEFLMIRNLAYILYPLYAIAIIALHAAFNHLKNIKKVTIRLALTAVAGLLLITFAYFISALISLPLGK